MLLNKSRLMIRRPVIAKVDRKKIIDKLTSSNPNETSPDDRPTDAENGDWILLPRSGRYVRRNSSGKILIKIPHKLINSVPSKGICRIFPSVWEEKQISGLTTPLYDYTDSFSTIT